jgi:predicted RNA-binding Zn ribbon-like protein
MTNVLSFDLDGGRPCLDFANTLDSSGEHLNIYSDLVAFAAQSQLITPQDADWLRAAGARDALAAEDVLRRATHLRTAIYAIFAAVAAGDTPDQRDLAQLNAELAATLRHARVVSADAGDDGASYRWGWAGRDLDAPLWGVTRSAAVLLTNNQERRRVRECGGADCRWLFLDTSKNRTRQWCSMQSCGNRQKAKRHYQKLRAARPTAS